MDHELQFHMRYSSQWLCIGDCPKSFSHREDFVAHIFGDLLGNSNLDLNIDEIVDSRESRTAHEPSMPVNCPFCLETIEENRRAFQKHVGRHLEEIALNSLSRKISISSAEEEEEPEYRDIGAPESLNKGDEPLEPILVPIADSGPAAEIETKASQDV